MTTRQATTTNYAAGNIDINRDLTRALQTDAALNPNLFHYNTNVLNYYLQTPRNVVHSTSTKYRRAK
jgi:hypothetical protein